MVEVPMLTLYTLFMHMVHSNMFRVITFCSLGGLTTLSLE